VDTNQQRQHQSAELRRIPHSVFGIGAFLLVLLAAFVLILLSGQLRGNSSAVMLTAILVVVLIAFTVLIAKRWRRARVGRTSSLAGSR
jgi:membrane protein YdbS with pleckstrin-like domain